MRFSFSFVNTEIRYMENLPENMKQHERMYFEDGDKQE